MFKKNIFYFVEATFTIDGMEIIPIYDPPHLLKGMRNNLLNKNLRIVREFDGKKETIDASWNVIVAVYLLDKQSTVARQLQLTEEHVIVDKIHKMRVKHAAQVFSNSVAGYIETATRNKCKYSTIK